MAEVLSPPSVHGQGRSSSPHTPRTSSPDSFDHSAERTPRPQPRERVSSYARRSNARASTYSGQTSHSRPQSTVYPAFHSTLPYALVRDFAYPAFHPMHYGPTPESHSGATTPGSEWNSNRRLSDPMDAWNGSSSRGSYSAGIWGGDGAMYPEPEGGMEALPSTSFGEEGGHEDEGMSASKGKHRRSRSYDNISEWERGRRRESGSRRGRESGSHFDQQGHLGFSSSQFDPAGQESLRHSRGFAPGSSRRESHMGATLPSRSFHNGSSAFSPDSEDPLPLDAEPHHPSSPQRASMGPEDELFAGESLALYSFEPENPNELRLTEGQIILVSYRHGQGWLVAEDPDTGEQGLVPEDYVRLVKEIEGWDPERGGFIEDDSLMEQDQDEEQDEDENNDFEDESPEEDSGPSARSGEPATPQDSLPAIDHAQGLHMRDLRADAGGGESKAEEDRRQDSAHAQR